MAATTSQKCDQTDSKLSNLGPANAGMADRAMDAAASVAHSAEGAASYVGQKAEDATAAVGGGLKSLSSTIRAHTPRDGMVGDASSAVANTLENTGRYLQDEGLTGIAEDVTNLIRRNPLPAVLVSIGFGFMLAKITTRS